MKKHSKRLLTAAALVMTTNATIHIINKVIAASACLKEMLDTDVRNYYHWRFGDIYYTKKGKKITVRNLSQLKTVIFHFYSSSNSSSSISSV